jgi:hypothetical protein
MKRAALLVAITLCSLVHAQTPEVAIFADLRPTWFVETGQTSRVRWYDPHGFYSVFGFHIVLETGNIVRVTQRLEKINNDGDPDSIDEAYIENRGSWRIGKQYLPFGQQNILRETAPAIRYDTELVFDGIPITLSASDNRDGLTRGVFARIGNDIGVSAAFGDHIGIQGSALTQFRRPEDAPGRGRGYQRALGFDTKYAWGGGVVEAEWVTLSDGNTLLDVDRSLSDVRYRFSTVGTEYVLTFGWSRSWDEQRDWYRAFAEIPINNKLVWEPFVRFRGFGWQDMGITVHLRL